MCNECLSFFFSGQVEEGSDEVYCQVLLVPKSEVRLTCDYYVILLWFILRLEKVLLLRKKDISTSEPFVLLYVPLVLGVK